MDEEIRKMLEAHGVFDKHDRDKVVQAYKDVLQNQEIEDKVVYEDIENKVIEPSEEIIEEKQEKEFYSDKKKITEKDLFRLNNDGVLIVNEKYREKLNEYDLSDIDWTDVDVRGLDFRNTNPKKLDPQKVHRKSLKDTDFSVTEENADTYLIKKDWNFDGVDITGANLSNPTTIDSFNVPKSIIDAKMDYDAWKNLPKQFQIQIIKDDKVDEEIINRAYENATNRINENVKQEEHDVRVVASNEMKQRPKAKVLVKTNNNRPNAFVSTIVFPFIVFSLVLIMTIFFFVIII